MNMLIDTFQRAGESPWSWAVVALLAVAALISLYHWWTCPHLCRRGSTVPDPSPPADAPVIAGPRFVIVMLAGIASVLVGLAMVSHEANPPLALFLIAAGVFAVRFEPAVLSLHEAVRRLGAARQHGPEAVAAAEDRLSNAHVWLVATNFMILGAVVAALLAF